MMPKTKDGSIKAVGEGGGGFGTLSVQGCLLVPYKTSRVGGERCGNLGLLNKIMSYK